VFEYEKNLALPVLKSNSGVGAGHPCLQTDIAMHDVLLPTSVISVPCPKCYPERVSAGTVLFRSLLEFYRNGINYLVLSGRKLPAFRGSDFPCDEDEGRYCMNTQGRMSRRASSLPPLSVVGLSQGILEDWHFPVTTYLIRTRRNASPFIQNS